MQECETGAVGDKIALGGRLAQRGDDALGRALVDDAADKRAVGDLKTALVAETVAARLEVLEA